jgi:hypothetical protein
MLVSTEELFHDGGTMHSHSAHLFALAALAPGLLLAPPARPATEGTAQPTTVAVLPLRALGAPAESARALDKTLRNEVEAVPEARLVDRAAVEAALQQEADCLARVRCAAAAAVKAGAQQLIVGTVSRLGDAFTLDLKLVDAQTGQELRRATHPMSGKEDALIELLRGIAVELLAPARYTGRLAVLLAGETAAEALGAELFVDGQRRGTLPLSEPIGGLSPGVHTLRVAKQDFRDATLFVEVRFDRTTQARIDLARGALAAVDFVRGKPEVAAQPAPPQRAPPQPAPPQRAPPPVLAATAPQAPPRDPWLKIAGWSGVGVGAAAFIAGVVIHAKAYGIAADLNRRNSANQLTLADRAAYDRVDNETRTARILYVTGTLFAAGGAGALLYDRHLDQERLRVEAAALPSGGAVAVAGRF